MDSSSPSTAFFLFEWIRLLWIGLGAYNVYKKRKQVCFETRRRRVQEGDWKRTMHKRVLACFDLFDRKSTAEKTAVREDHWKTTTTCTSELSLAWMFLIAKARPFFVEFWFRVVYNTSVPIRHGGVEIFSNFRKDIHPAMFYNPNGFLRCRI